MDLNRIASAALESFMEEQGAQSEQQSQGRKRPLRGLGALAAGVGLAVAARVAYSRVRDLDLERLGGAVEDRLGE